MADKDVKTAGDLRSFAGVLDDELDEIGRSRKERKTDIPVGDRVPGQESTLRAWNSNLRGLAFSGGGIRSATFNIGVLQALAEQGLLKTVDYLSTISGGGYTGSWFISWCKREGGVQQIEKRLATSISSDPGSPDLRPIRSLREYSNYLSPQPGFFSADTWTMLSVWIRNAFLNQLVLIATLSFVLLMARVIGKSLEWSAGTFGENALLLSAGGAVIALLLSCIRCAVSLSWFSAAHRTEADAAARRTQSSVVTFVVLPVLISSCLGACALWVWLVPVKGNAWLASAIAGAIFFTLLVVISFVGRYPSAFYARREDPIAKGLRERCWCLGWTFFSALLAGATGGLLIRIFSGILGDWAGANTVWRLVVLGTPAVALIFVVTKVIHVGILGFNFPDERREWWSRAAAWLVICSLAWLGVFVVAIYGPLWVAKAGSWISSGVAAGWLMATWKGLSLAGSSDTGKASVSEPPEPAPWKNVLAIAVPYIFVAGLALWLSFALHIVLVRLTKGSWYSFQQLDTQHWAIISPAWPWLFGALVAMLAVASLMGWRVDVNEFSLHHFYKNRLVRAYLGATRIGRFRHPNPFTGFDPFDDPKLARFRVVDPIPAPHTDAENDLLNLQDPARSGKPYVGPYPILGTALNLAKGEDLAWQERMAQSFVFTPLYCGFEIDKAVPLSGLPPDIEPSLDGFRPTEKYGYGQLNGPALGTAVAISGAAANPNSGYHTSPATAVLMTFFNTRLGWWMGNPRHKTKWQTSSPEPWGLAYLVKELARDTTDTSDYVNLSDGGHFENLGIYELVRRRCRFIIASDAEEDHDMTFGGLGSAIRKCRTDFGVEISIDLAKVRRRTGTRFSEQHFAMGSIRYPDIAEEGTLLYIKSSLTGDETSDVREYADREKAFPHQTTGDQWFDESQFESYRQLGYLAARAAFTAMKEQGHLAIPSQLTATAG